MAVRLVLADDHPIVLHGLKQLFERHDGFDVVALCPDAGLTIDAVRARRPDLLVLDLRMPERNGFDVLRTLANESLTCRTILLTASITEAEVVEAVKLGVFGVVLKESSPDTLMECVRRVSRGEQWIDPGTLTRAFNVLAHQGDPSEARQPLTAREVEIVRMIAQGSRNKTIAERLSISQGTVKVHLHNIYGKLGVDGRLALLVRAQDQGLI